MADPFYGALGAAAAPHGRGFLGSVTHVLGKTITNLEDAAIGSAGAAVKGGEYAFTHNPVDTLSQIPGIAENIAKGTFQDLQHPLRNPGYTLLDLLGIAGGAGGLLGRVGEAGRVAAGTSKLADLGTGGLSQSRQLTHALLHGPAPEARFFKSGDLAQKAGYFSKNPTIKAAQKLLDRAHEVNPDFAIPGLFKSQDARIFKAGRVENILQPFTRNIARDLPAKLVAKYKGLTPAEFVAGRVVAEGVTPEARIAYHEKQLASGLPERLARETRQQIGLLEGARQFLTTKDVQLSNGEIHQLPVVKPEHEKLAQFVEDARNLSNMKDDALMGAGALTEKAHVNRLLGPLNLISGRGLPENLGTLRKSLAQQRRIDGATPSAKQLNLQAHISHLEGQMKLGEEDPTTAPLHDKELAQNLFYMPYKLERGGKTTVSMTTAYKGGKPTTPSRLTHEFKGEILKGGTGRLDLAHVLAENYIESSRFLHFKDMYDRLQKSAVDDPNLIPAEYRQAILSPGSKQFPKELRFAQDLLQRSPSEELTGGKAEAAARWFEPVRRFIFNPTPEEEKIYGVKYIDKRQLGGLNEQNPLLTAFDNPTFRRVVKFTDAVNSGQKAALLYLKPAYLFPNGLGNLALNLVQQGFLAPANLAKSTVLLRRIDPEVRASIRTAMGGGLTHILESDKSVAGRITSGSNKLASVYGKIIDDPFRFSSFLHEARLEGFVKPEELKALTQDEKYHDTFEQVTKRANDEIIDYERLGPGEQSILRRLVFFYPWVKGSSRYAVQMVTNHPTAAGLVGQAGKQETDFAHSILGNVPSYAEGIVPSGPVKNGIVDVQNPNSFAILQQPAELMKEIQNLFGKSNPDLSAAQNLTPVDSAFLDLLTSGASNPFHKAGTPAYKTALDDIYGGNPLKSLIDNFTSQRKPGAVYPQQTHLEALARFGLTGGLTKRPYNIAAGQANAYRQEHP